VGANTGREGRAHGHKTGRGPFSWDRLPGGACARVGNKRCERHVIFSWILQGHEPCARATPIRRLCIANRPRGSEPSPSRSRLLKPRFCFSRRPCTWRSGHRTRSVELRSFPSTQPLARVTNKRPQFRIILSMACIGVRAKNLPDAREKPTYGRGKPTAQFRIMLSMEQRTSRLPRRWRPYHRLLQQTTPLTACLDMGNVGVEEMKHGDHQTLIEIR
jgi:hypothetical protein